MECDTFQVLFQLSYQDLMHQVHSFLTQFFFHKEGFDREDLNEAQIKLFLIQVFS